MLNVLSWRESLIVFAAGFSALASAQSGHIIHAVLVTSPGAANSTFTVKLTMSPSDIDVSAFDIKVGYDSTLGELESVTDNTGQPGANIDYITAGPFPLSSVAYANVYKYVGASTSANIIHPVNLAQLNFKTSATYNDPSHKFWVYVGPYTESGGPGGLYDYTFQPVTTSYDSITPTSSVSDWSVY